MKEYENTKDLSSKVIFIVNIIKDYDDDFTNKRIVEKVLRNMPSNFE